MAQIVPPCAFFHYFMDVERSIGPNVLLGLGIYDPDFLIVPEDRGKKGQGM
jgi:hypothetical protein